MKTITVTKSSLPKFDDFTKKIRPLWSSRHLTNMGKMHNELEKKLEGYLKVNNVLLYTNGHTALEYALELISKKGEIITTPFTFASTTQAIIRTGHTPVFCDIKEDFTIDESLIEKLITDKTVAILPVHVYGNICNVEKIDEIAKKYDLKVIYDAAHVFGVTYKDKGIGTYGYVSMFSFHATKVFHTIEGGALSFNDDLLRGQLFSTRNFGQVTPEDVEFVGGNGKMDEFRATMGLCMLNIVDSEIEKRNQVYDRYMHNLQNVEGLRMNRIQDNVKSNYAYFPIVIDGFRYDRNQAYELLKEHNIISRKYFYPLTSSFKAYKDLFDINNTPTAEDISNKVLCLPLYPDLDLEDVDKICDILLRR